ncbi:DNA repair protein RecO [Pseudorhodobacter sp. E13]|uniref:DNA repair protein RecO n=1 Tax=Pseudorhodobacter sp. E13 TaxID=2487931 RepID=UPI000F8C941B|nr:DNA repair protein RecO [Pseudorhodobacter sp. E13]RUS60268.1 DNA repair protein RecO [Pseudorhodobacter sp. E13]
MEWQDEGVLIAMRPHGEASAIIEVFTAVHGRHAGVVRGGASRKVAAIMQPGTQLAVTWRARLEDHIGSFSVEPLQSRAALLGDRLALAGLSAICAMLRVALPEREGHPNLWRATMALLAALEHDPDWPALYLRWELILLEELGFGLDLTRCAATGSRDDLAFVSPKTGRAVSRGGAGEWADRLFPLPQCLMGQGPASAAEVAQGLAITGHFLARELAPVLGNRPMPEARTRLLTMLEKRR